MYFICISHVTNLALWLQYFNKLSYLLTLWTSKYAKILFGRSSAPDTAGGAHDVPRIPARSTPVGIKIQQRLLARHAVAWSRHYASAQSFTLVRWRCGHALLNVCPCLWDGRLRSVSAVWVAGVCAVCACLKLKTYSHERLYLRGSREWLTTITQPPVVVASRGIKVQWRALDKLHLHLYRVRQKQDYLKRLWLFYRSNCLHRIHIAWYTIETVKHGRGLYHVIVINKEYEM